MVIGKLQKIKLLLGWGKIFGQNIDPRYVLYVDKTQSTFWTTFRLLRVSTWWKKITLAYGTIVEKVLVLGLTFETNYVTRFMESHPTDSHWL